MDRPKAIWELLTRSRLIALLSPKRAEDCIAAYEALAPLDVVIEIAMRTDAAIQGMHALRQKHPDALFLAGTVMTAEQANHALDAGAAGIVSPDYFPDVLEICIERDAMCVPGGLSDAGKQLAHKAALLECTIDELR